MRSTICGLNLDDRAKHRDGNIADEFDAVDEIVDRRVIVGCHCSRVGDAVDQRGRDTEWDTHQGAGNRIEGARCIHARITGFERTLADADGADGCMAAFPAQCQGRRHRCLVEGAYGLGLEGDAQHGPLLTKQVGKPGHLAIGAGEAGDKSRSAFERMGAAIDPARASSAATRPLRATTPSW